MPSSADKGQKSIVIVARAIAERLGVDIVQARLAGQMPGKQFDDVTAAFISNTFARLRHLRAAAGKSCE